ncbi:Anthranilate synthase component 1 [Planctomycetes bacterium Pan216]|uniref:Anthranilate synthase component 1 n=1 Tax=Kolteria novifilia TaxID=2527975 RepID=A0A518B5S3_9BACT|nr:Anthranilate synthase component 1 [Planctomycetes bacterium Pan216]
MAHYPDLTTFGELAADHSVVPVYRQLFSDTLTPVSAFARLDAGDWSFLFESVVGGEKVGRYSFIGGWPFLRFEAKGNEVTLEDADGPRTHTSEAPLEELNALIAKYRAPHLPGLPRFTGGAVGYAGYDAIRYIESLPNAPTDDRDLADLSFGFYDQMIVFDHITKVVLVIVLAHIDPDDVEGSYRKAGVRVDELVATLDNRGDHALDLVDVPKKIEPTREFASNFTREGFMAAVEKCKEYIRAGDFFQIVLSQRFQSETEADAFEIYRTLRVVNPSPFMVYLTTPQVTLVASSPEIMVRVENGWITTRPLAGTRQRGASDEEDRALAEELLADPKERAEHIMLVDLGRNDVGRVSEFDTVKLADVMTVERYSHVMHITSNVTGKLRKDLSPLDALWACLPAGTVSGAPKVRAMEVIDEMEPHRRGPYAGAIGYVDFTGNMDTCIALRTLVMTGKTAYVQAGAGLVYDSDPASEYNETLNKAKGLFTAIEITEQRLRDRDRNSSS